MNGHRLLRRLRSPQYLSAILYWGASQLFRLQAHKVLSVSLAQRADAVAGFPGRYSFVAICDLRQLAELGAAIEAQIDEQSGMSCRSMLSRGDRVYAVLEANQVACQLNIRRGPVTVDSPTDLVFEFPRGDLFLNYLHTRDAHRGRGLATKLILLACADASDGLAQRCFSHVRATNYQSIAAFRRCGWSEVGLLLTTRSGRFITASRCEAAGMTVRVVSVAESSA